jgi:hypothetical protein
VIRKLRYHSLISFPENYRYLASTTGSNISILITYIVFLTKMQKGKPPKKGFALLKNDITGSERTV